MEKNDLKKIYEEFYSLSIEITELIKTDNFNELAVLLNKKDEIIKNINTIKSNSVFTEQEKAEYNAFANKIKENEDKNIQLIENKKEELKHNILNNNQAAKTISSYKVKKEVQSTYIDERE